MRKDAFTLVELLVTLGIIGVLVSLVTVVSHKAMTAASLASSANNIRQLAAGAAAYLGEHNNQYWRYREGVFTDEQMSALGVTERGVRWWFGFEAISSVKAAEGQREFDPSKGPLGEYVPAGMVPDPSFTLAGNPMKPKYRFGYIGVGYNVHLAAGEAPVAQGWSGAAKPRSQLTLDRPGRIVVFATSAQVNTFQSPASAENPMIEEFYGFDDGSTGNQPSIHFRHHGKAMVAFADGSADWLPMDESTRDRRDPDAWIGRFAPAGSPDYLTEAPRD